MLGYGSCFSHSFACHQTQIVFAFTFSHSLVLIVPTHRGMDGQIELILAAGYILRWIFSHRELNWIWSPIAVLTWPSIAQLHWCMPNNHQIGSHSATSAYSNMMLTLTDRGAYNLPTTYDHILVICSSSGSHDHMTNGTHLCIFLRVLVDLYESIVTFNPSSWTFINKNINNKIFHWTVAVRISILLWKICIFCGTGWWRLLPV